MISGKLDEDKNLEFLSVNPQRRRRHEWRGWCRFHGQTAIIGGSHPSGLPADYNLKPSDYSGLAPADWIVIWLYNSQWTSRDNVPAKKKFWHMFGGAHSRSRSEGTVKNVKASLRKEHSNLLGQIKGLKCWTPPRMLITRWHMGCLISARSDYVSAATKRSKEIIISLMMAIAAQYGCKMLKTDTKLAFWIEKLEMKRYLFALQTGCQSQFLKNRAAHTLKWMHTIRRSWLIEIIGIHENNDKNNDKKWKFNYQTD